MKKSILDLSGLLMLISLLHCFSLFANDFTVEMVSVDVQADSATKARELAILEAQKQAFSILVERLLPENKKNSFQEINEAQLEKLVKTFEVTREKKSSTRYAGTFSIEFRPKATEKYLGIQENAEKPSTSKKLIIPAYSTNEKLVLWESDNPWLAAWNTESINNSNVIVPVGDIEDLQNLSAKDLMNKDPKNFENILHHYQADAVILCILEQEEGQTNSYVLSIQQFTPVHTSKEEVVFLKDTPDTNENFWKHSIQETLDYFNKNIPIKAVNLTKNKEQILHIPFQNFQEWLEIQQKLQKSEFLGLYQITSLTKKEATISIISDQTFDGLKNSFKHLGLDLNSTGEHWTLSVATVPSPLSAHQITKEALE